MKLENALNTAVSLHKEGKLEEAEKIYRLILTKQPAHPDVNHNLGVLLKSKSMIPDAIKLFENAIQSNSSIKQFWISYLETLQASGMLQLAKEVCVHAIENGVIEPGSGEGEHFNTLPTLKGDQRTSAITKKVSKHTLDNIISKLKKNEFDNSLKQLCQLIFQYPEDDRLYDLIGLCRIHTGSSFVAIPYIKAAITLNNDKPTYTAHLANALLNTRSYRASISAFQKYQGLTGKNEKVLLNISIAYAALNETDKEISYLQEALKIAPKFCLALNNFGLALKREQRFDEAISQFEKSIASNPEYVDPLINLGNLYLEINESLMAIECYEKVLALNPHSSTVLSNLATAHKKLGNFAEATLKFRQALAINKNNYEALFNFGNLYSEQSDHQNAIECYTQALKLNPNYIDAYINLGVSQKLSGDTASSIQTLQSAFKLEPNNVFINSNLGAAHFELHDTNEAEKWYLNALKLSPNHTEVICNLCELYETTNNISKLRHFLTQNAAHHNEQDSNILLYRAILETREKTFERAYEYFSQVDPSDLNLARKILFYYSFAKVCDRLQSYNKAADLFKKANEVAALNKSFDKNIKENYSSMLANNLRIESQRQFHTLSEMQYHNDATPIFLIGFPRSGTTLLDTCLRSHSKIAVIEEQPLFENAIAKASLNSLSISHDQKDILAKKNQAAQHYLDSIKIAADQNKLIVDKLPLNIVYLPQILDVFPKAKIVFALRHPLDCILSCWMQNFKLNAAMMHMLELDDIVSLYEMSMDILINCLERREVSFHTVKYENIVGDMKQECTKLLTFLSQEWEDQILNFNETALKRSKINTPSYSQVSQPIYRDALQRWTHYSFILSPYKQRIQPYCDQFQYELF